MDHGNSIYLFSADVNDQPGGSGSVLLKTIQSFTKDRLGGAFGQEGQDMETKLPEQSEGSLSDFARLGNQFFGNNTQSVLSSLASRGEQEIRDELHL